jgi:hypothetical protein
MHLDINPAFSFLHSRPLCQLCVGCSHRTHHVLVPFLLLSEYVTVGCDDTNALLPFLFILIPKLLAISFIVNIREALQGAQHSKGRLIPFLSIPLPITEDVALGAGSRCSAFALVASQFQLN